MKFTCQKDQLVEAVLAASRAVSARSTIESIEGILITAAQDSITVTGYNLSTGIEIVLEASVEQPGRCVLNARTLGDVVRRLPDDTVSAISDSRQVITIKSGAFEAALMGMDPESYPCLPQELAQTELKLKVESLRNIVKRTIFAVAVNDTNPILTGVLIKASEGQVTAVAVDRFRLGLAREELLGGIDGEKSFVVPGRDLAEIGRLISVWNEDVTLSVSENHLMITMGSLNFVCRLLEGSFINYESVIPQTHKTAARVDTQQLIDSLERAGVVINEKLRSPVFLKFEDKTISVSCSSSLGKVRDHLGALIEGEPCEMSVNNRYMLEALKACDAETIQIKLLSPLSPILIEPEEGAAFTLLVVPTNNIRAAQRDRD